MEKHPYNAHLTKGLFWYAEERKVLELMMSGQTLGEIRAENEKENLFGVASPTRAHLVFRRVAERIEAMGDDFPSFFMSMDRDTQKLLVLASIMAVDTLFFEFVFEIYRNKLILGIDELENRDFLSFFNDRQMTDQEVSTWKPETFRRLGIVYRNLLRNAGLLENVNRQKWRIMRSFPDMRMEEFLKKLDMEPVWKALMGEE